MMINTTELKGLQFVIDENGGIIPISKALSIMINKQNDKLAKFESIVKTVDPDNLPVGEVLAFNGRHTLDESKLYIDSDDGEVWAVYSHDFTPDENTHIGKVTHYIEQKDLLGMFNDN